MGAKVVERNDKLSVERNIVRICMGVIILIGLFLILILACIYGTRLNCYYIDEENKHFRQKKIPTMTHFPRIADYTLTALSDTNGAQAFMKTIGFSNVPGKEMQGSVLRLDAGKALKFTQLYEALAVVISGRLDITDGTTQSFVASAGDSMYIPCGTKVEYNASQRSFLYFVSQPAALRMFTEIQKTVDSSTGSKIIRAENFNTAKPNIPLFVNTDKSLSYLNDTLFSNVEGAELTGGLYKLLKGPALEYTYEYEEFKYIVEGEFHLRDGTGKFVKAKGGDLMYFPKGVYVHFTSPNSALGFYVGQRLGGTA